MKAINRNDCKGQIIILFAISLIALLGMVGLALDSGRAYGVKARLSAAVDAAAIAAARGLTVGATDADRIANARAAGLKFYNANFSQQSDGFNLINYMGATRLAPTVNAVHNINGYWQVDVSGSATMPTTFMNVLNWQQVTVGASGTTIKRDLDMILVLDNSLSLQSVFSQVITSAKNFVGNFIPTTDRIGLVTFGYGSVLNVPIDKTASRGFNNANVIAAINAMGGGSPYNNLGSTASAEGMRRALNEINAVPALWRSSLRVIVFFSDGAPNTIAANFPRTSGSPNPILGNLFSGLNSTPNPNDVYNNGSITSTPTNPANISTLPLDSNSPASITTPITITDVGATSPFTPLAIPLYDLPLTGQRLLVGTPYTNIPCNVNKAARNMLEKVANMARSWKESGVDQPIAVYSLGLGAQLNSNEINFCGYGASEYGANIMMRVANASNSDTHQPAPQPTGLYCYAADTTALDSCFSAIASDMLRLSQ